MPNHCLIYAFDCEKSQYLWANHGYNGVKKYLRQKASENALTWQENEARKGTPNYDELERYEISDLEVLKNMFVNEYDQWKDVITLRRPLIYKEVPTPYPVVDELLPKIKQRPLNFTNLLCVARKPTATAAGFDIAPDNARERRSDRFDQEAFDPSAEGNLTRWRYVSMLAMPELTCPRCRKIFPEGMLVCLACGLSLATMSDMRRACQVFRLEELAEKLGFELTLDLLGDDDVAGTTQGAKQIRSAAAVLKKSRPLIHEASEKSRADFATASGNGRPLRLQLRSPRPYTSVYALDYRFGQRGASLHQTHPRGDPNWKDSAVQSAYVHGRIRRGTDEDNHRG